MEGRFQNLLRSQRKIYLAIICFLGVLFWFSIGLYFLSPTTTQTAKYTSQKSQLHLLVPATSSNPDLCRLLLSAAVLQYPAPILINWGAKEAADAYVQHLAKVETILSYLDILYSQGKFNDLVLIVDGFDVHFQLPPSVLLTRYYAQNLAANLRTEAQVGHANFTAHGLKQTVIFGHDKLCWPEDPKRPACWAVPNSTDAEFAFGPNTDKGDPVFNRARWLNSGTIIGPIDDVRDVFIATLDLINTNHTTDSDQFYFANVYGTQEYARRLLTPDPFGDVEGKELDWPVVREGQRTEFGIGIDYEGAMFQTMAFYREWITWMTFDGVGAGGGGGETLGQLRLSSDSYYDKVLPGDLATARPPFPASGYGEEEEGSSSQGLPMDKSWSDLALGVNAISSHIFTLLHFTGPKEFRQLWWSRVWYFPFAEQLLKVKVEGPETPISTKPLGGKIWWNVKQAMEEGLSVQKGSAWADKGEFLSWDRLCKAHEWEVFGKEEPKGEESK